MIAEVIIQSNVKKLNKTFDYKLPEEYEKNALELIGARVLVPFGRMKTLEEGYIVNIKEATEYEVKEIAKIEEKYYLIPSIKVKAIDSTGAGDIFHGAFAYFISHQYGLKRSCYLANIAGALSVTTLGGRISIPKLEDVLEREQEIELL